MIKWMTTIFKTTMKTETQWTDQAHGPFIFTAILKITYLDTNRFTFETSEK